jgi:hypothetical protein
LKDFHTQQTIISTILLDSFDNFDSDTAFLLPSQLQDSLEMLFEYDQCPVSGMLTKLIDSDSEATHGTFLTRVIATVQDILQYFELRQELENVLFAMTFRYAFEKLYALGKSSLVGIIADEDDQRIGAFVDQATFAVVQPPERYSPPHEPESLISDVFRESDEYFMAVVDLRSIRFYTNPIDILNVIIDCLKEIMTAVGITGDFHESLLPFDDTFGLFLSVWIAAGVAELKWYRRFVSDYLPPDVHSRLNQNFQFADTKLTSVVNYIRMLVIDRTDRSTKTQ